MLYVKYDPTQEFYKSIVGAVPEGVRFAIRLQLNRCITPEKVTLVVYGDDGDFSYEQVMYLDQSGDGFDNYIADVQFQKGLYWYYFRMDGVPFERYIGVDSSRNACLFYQNVKPWQLSVYKKQYSSPLWLNKGVMYQILVDRFYHKGDFVVTEDKILRPWGEQPFYREEADGIVRNRDFFGGNLQGIIAKLPYLASLNVKTLYLNPVFKAYSNHKYDIEDYELIDPMFGTQEDFEQLCAEAQKLDIKIILDGVFNHTGSSSKYFNREKKYGTGGAYNDCDSPYRKWYNFHPDNTYECWWSFPTLPRINAENKGVQKYFCAKNGIVRRWLNCGTSGWRLGVVDEIADCMLDKIVASAKAEKSDCAIIGEVWEDASNKVDYGIRRHYLDGSQLDSVMNYPLMNSIITFVRDGNEAPLAATVFDIINNYPFFVRNNLMNILGTHDTSRILTSLAGDRVDNSSKDVLARTKLTDEQYKRGCRLLKLAAVLQYTMFGFPCVFYGDEVAMEGYRDPFCRGCYPWGKENKIILDFYRRLGQLRTDPVFAEGDFRQVVAEKGVYAFERILHQTQMQILVGVNCGEEEYSLNISDTYEDVFTGRRYTNICKLQKLGYVILKKV